MKNILKFIIFIIYTICIFFIKDRFTLVCLFIINVLLGILIKINFKKMLNDFLFFLPFIIITVIFNIIFENLQYGALIGARLIICYNITYSFSKTFTIMEFAETIEKLCYPLKFLKINPRDVGIIVSISLCMISVFKNEIQETIKAMKSKGKKIRIRQIVLIMKPIVISLLKKTNEMEKALISKGYM